MEHAPNNPSKLDAHASLMKDMSDLAFEIGKIKNKAHFAHLRPDFGLSKEKTCIDLNGSFDV